MWSLLTGAGNKSESVSELSLERFVRFFKTSVVDPAAADRPGSAAAAAMICSDGGPAALLRAHLDLAATASPRPAAADATVPPRLPPRSATRVPQSAMV